MSTLCTQKELRVRWGSRAAHWISPWCHCRNLTLKNIVTLEPLKGLEEHKARGIVCDYCAITQKTDFYETQKEVWNVAGQPK